MRERYSCHELGWETSDFAAGAPRSLLEFKSRRARPHLANDQAVSMLSASGEVEDGSERQGLPKAEWTVVTVQGLPEGLPFTSKHEYLQCYCADSSIKGGEARTIYADKEAVEALTRVIAAAEDKQALIAFDNGLPRLATYFDTLWAIEPHDWYQGDKTDVDNNHAAWLVVKPLTPTGRVPKHPYEVTFNAQDYGQANHSSGTVSYRPDGSPGKLRMIYWRAGTMYDVRFEAGEGGSLEPVKVTQDDGTGKQVVWAK